MGAEANYRPFEVVEEKRRTILRLHGTGKQSAKVEADRVHIVMDAVAQGWDTDIEYADIEGDLDIGTIMDRLERDKDGRYVVPGNVRVEYSNIDGKVSFRGASFNGEASFFEAGFNGRASFGAASFNGEAYFGGASFKDDPELRGTGDDRLSPYSFASIGLVYRKCMLPGASYFFEKAGHGYWLGKDFLNASGAFRDAKVEYEKEGKYNEAGGMYVWERDSIMRQLGFQRGKRLKWIWFWIWKYASNYGEAPLRFIGVAAIMVAVFAVLYMPIVSSIPVVSDWFSWWPSITFREYPFHPWSTGIVKGFLYNIVTAIYFSAVTFATLGFGDIAPVSIVGKFLTVIQVLLGYVMFGILVTLVARKMTRS